MVSIDTYVRPYQLLTMLDHIEAGDDAVASVHATTLLLKKENEKKAQLLHFNFSILNVPN